MTTQLDIDASRLSPQQRQVLEELTGQRLTGQSRVTIVLSQAGTQPASDRPAQSVQDWLEVYEGMSENQVEQVDAAAKQRANLTRDIS